MRFSDLGLKMGDVMQLQTSAESEARYPVKLLGFLPDCSVIISAPVNAEKKTIFVREDQMVTLRFVVRNVASGFSARVLGTRTSPKPYIHLEMPKQVQAVEVRNAVRIDVNIQATIINETRKSDTIAVNVTNMSVMGGRFDCNRKIALIDDKLSLTLTVNMDDFERLITIDCEVRNKGEIFGEGGEVVEGEDKKAAGYWYGIVFKNLSEDDLLIMKAFVYQEILKSLHML